jgi:quercetin dioxygenase-like cupin family protein
MSEPILIAAGEGEVIGDAPDRRVEILSDDETLNATWSRFAAGRAGADLHVHHHHVDLFYVLEGELTLRLGVEGETVAVPAGTLARVAPGVVHGFRNDSDSDMRYLNLHAPGQGFADYMRGLRDGRPILYDQHDPPDDGGGPTSAAVIGAAQPLGEDATLLADIEVIAIAELRHDPAATPLAAHVRPAHVASYFVLEGELALTLDAGELRAPAGAWVQVPAGLEHFVAAGGDAPVRYLGLHTPGAGAATLRPGVSQPWRPPLGG